VQVLHMDRNDYYGGAAASLNLNQVSGAMVVTLAEFDVLHLMDVLVSTGSSSRFVGD
jgi:RAB protein geranylgeranyltransferase component A